LTGLDRVRDGPVDVHRYVFLDRDRVWDVFLNRDGIRYVFLNRHVHRSVHDDRSLLDDMHRRRAVVSVAVLRAQQSVVGQAVPIAVPAVPVAQTPQASFALFLLHRLFGRFVGLDAHQRQARARQQQH